jgi:hypothetical protein
MITCQSFLFKDVINKYFPTSCPVKLYSGFIYNLHYFAKESIDSDFYKKIIECIKEKKIIHSEELKTEKINLFTLGKSSFVGKIIDSIKEKEGFEALSAIKIKNGTYQFKGHDELLKKIEISLFDILKINFEIKEGKKRTGSRQIESPVLFTFNHNELVVVAEAIKEAQEIKFDILPTPLIASCEKYIMQNPEIIFYPKMALYEKKIENIANKIENIKNENKI